MKFQKFFKSIVPDGVVFTRENGDRWLASSTVLALVPPTVQVVLGEREYQMPEEIENFITRANGTEEAFLTEAIMPIPNGKIRDCMRKYSDMSGKITITIANDDWTLIERGDAVEIRAQ